MTLRLKTKLCNLELVSPVVLLSGCVGFGDEYTRIKNFSKQSIGAICLKGTTLKARLGNDTPRIWETSSGMLNAIGLQNPGTDEVINSILPNLDRKKTKYIINVSGVTIKEYQEITKRFDDSDIDAIEINISCPNINEGYLLFGNDIEMSYRVVAACRSCTDKLLITKLSPNQSNIKANAKRCIEAGSDALSVINTVTGMAIDIKGRKPIIHNNQAGLSGPAIKPIALLKVHEVYNEARKHQVPIIGQGGIVTATDAIEFLLAGASAIGIGTALFYDPLVVDKVCTGVENYLIENNFDSVADLVGKLEIN